MINNRQTNRRRGRNNPRQNGGGNRGNGDSGNRIDSRARGNATQLLEKYRNLARDAQLSGDRVNVEYYLQFADHYFRVLADNRARQEEQQQRFRRNDEGESYAYDGADDGDEGFDDGDDGFGPPPVQQQQERSERRPRGEDQQQPRERRNERAERSERPERNERPERTSRRRNEDAAAPRREPRVANDDAVDEDLHGGGLNLAALPPSIARSEPADEHMPAETPTGADETPVEDAAPPKPRRGRPRKTPAAAE